MSKKLADLQQQMHDLKAKATAVLDVADTENDGELSADAEAAFEQIEKDIAQLEGKIAKEQARIDRWQRMDAIATAPGSTARVAYGYESSTADPNPTLTHGFKNLGEFAIAAQFAAARPSSADPRLDGGLDGVHHSQGDVGEGYMVPPQFKEEIWELIKSQDSLLSDIDLEPTEKTTVQKLKDESTPWGGSGIQAKWRSEGQKMDPSKLDTSADSVAVHELYAFVLASEELLADASRLTSRLQTKSPQAIAWKASDSVAYGTGVGQPLGFMNSKALVTVDKEIDQEADSLVADNILKMYARHLVVPGDRPYWLTNVDTVPQLATMMIGDRPIWMPPNGLIDAPGGYLLGRPIKFSEHAKTLGDKGDISLISPKGYYGIRRTNGVDYAESIHLHFDQGLKAFRFMFRFGGQPHLSGPVKPANGANTKSHFVTLEERA